MRQSLPTHVIIDNLSSTPWYQLWIPIIIAVISVTLSCVSIYYAWRTFRINTRPYIWAGSFGYLQNNIIVPKPQTIMLSCKEYPAKVRFSVRVLFNGSVLFEHAAAESVQFPDGSQWTFDVGQVEYNTIMNRPVNEQAMLKRVIEINYSDLNNLTNYRSYIEQDFIPADNQWRTVSSDAN